MGEWVTWQGQRLPIAKVQGPFLAIVGVCAQWGALSVSN
jgi:hypothetical protein